MEYLLRLTLIWAALLFYYHFFFSQNDNWALKRRFLLGAYLLGLVIPSLPAIGVATKNLPLSSIPLDTYFVVLNNPLIPQTEGPFAFSWPLLLLSIYLLGTLVQLIRLSRHFLQLWYWNREGIKSSFGSFKVVRHATISSPFAAGNRIFLPLHLAPKVEEVAYLHEAAHLQHAHTAERLPMILGQVFLWFHPLQWLFDRELSAVQEFQADEVVTQAISKKEYGHILIQQSMLPLDHWQPGLFASPLKKRIHMMIRKKNKQPWRSPQILIFLGLVSVLLFACSDLLGPAELRTKDILPYTQVDQQASLLTSPLDASKPGSSIDHTLLETIYKNIKYPASARQSGTQAQIKAEFVIDQNGKLNQLQVFEFKQNELEESLEKIVVVGYGDTSNDKAKRDTQALLKEVERVLQELPDWRPAKKEGKAVPVAIALGFHYKLE